MLRAVHAALAALSVLLLATAVSAAPVFPDLITIEQEGVGEHFVVSSDMAQCASNGDGITFDCDGQGLSMTPGGYDFTLSDWDLALSLNPSVNSAFGFTNNSAIAQTFTITVTIPVAVIGPASLIGGSTGGSTTDANNDGAGGLSTSAPNALYEGLIDGGVALSIYPDPTSYTFVFGGQTITIPAMNPGLPGPSLGGPAVAATIGIRNKFTLSGGDSVAMTNFFDVEPVPEPSTAVLTALGLIGIAASGRRARR